MKFSIYIIKPLSILIVSSILAYVGNESLFHHHISKSAIENSYSQQSDINNDADCLLCDLVKNFQKYSSPPNDFKVTTQFIKFKNILKLNSFIANRSNPIQGRAPPAIKFI